MDDTADMVTTEPEVWMTLRHGDDRTRSSSLSLEGGVTSSLLRFDSGVPPRGKEGSSLYHHPCPPQPSGSTAQLTHVSAQREGRLQSLSPPLSSPALWINSPVDSRVGPEGRKAPVSITTLVLPSPLDQQPS
ncbi:hypothetical protein ACOMHN_051571 [Nucella lapillus]